MNEIEQYEFDRQGYIIIEDMLNAEQVASLAAVIDELEEHATSNLDQPPYKFSGWGARYHANPERGYHVGGQRAKDKTMVIEDYWNAHPAFDVLLDHEPTMGYVNAVLQERPTINNSEIRIRYTGNASGSHAVYQTHVSKYHYDCHDGRIDCKMVRMIYFVHDVSNEEGAFSVVPGTHKSKLPCPYSQEVHVDEEPGMIGLEVKAGDAIFFTENLRHGGFTNRAERTRKTLHVGYGPYWMMSQNIATMDEPQHITEETFERFTEAQRDLFRAWPPKEE